MAIRADQLALGDLIEEPPAIARVKERAHVCALLATREMIDYLVTTRGLSRDDAYMLTSAAADLHVTQVVDGVKGVHAMLPKSIFRAP